MPEDAISNRKVAFYYGCFANYYYPEEGEAMVKVLRKNGIKVIAPDQVCCALPMMAKGNTKGAYKNIRHNVEMLSKAVNNGYALIATCSSCSLFIKREYPRLLDSEEAKLVSQNMYHFSEYLLLLHNKGMLNIDFLSTPQALFYHTPCHLRAQEIGDITVKLLQLIPGITIKRVSKECCGMGGAYGQEKVNYKLSKEIGGKLFGEIREIPTDRIVTDCGGCKLQIEAGTGLKVEHPIIILQEAYGL